MRNVAGIMLVAVVAAGCNGDAEEATPPAAPVVTREQQLLTVVESGAEWIAALGADAQVRATSPAARSYAAILASDHRAVGREVASRTRQDTEPAANAAATALANEAQTARTALQQMTGTEFDLAFVENAIRLQQRLLETLAREVSGVRDSDVQQLANDTRPMLEAHIRRGRQLLPALRDARAGVPAAPTGPRVLGEPTTPPAERSEPAEAAPAETAPVERPDTVPAPAPDTTTPPDTSAAALAQDEPSR